MSASITALRNALDKTNAFIAEREPIVAQLNESLATESERLTAAYARRDDLVAAIAKLGQA
jgi:hypothetical protein